MYSDIETHSKVVSEESFQLFATPHNEQRKGSIRKLRELGWAVSFRVADEDIYSLYREYIGLSSRYMLVARPREKEAVFVAFPDIAAN